MTWLSLLDSLVRWLVVPSVGMGLNGRADAIWCYPIPLPTSPLKGEEKTSRLGRLTVLSAPLRGSPNKPPALPGVI